MTKKPTVLYLTAELVAREHALGTNLSRLVDDFLRQRLELNLQRTNLELREEQLAQLLIVHKMKGDILEVEMNEIKLEREKQREQVPKVEKIREVER